MTKRKLQEISRSGVEIINDQAHFADVHGVDNMHPMDVDATQLSAGEEEIHEVEVQNETSLPITKFDLFFPTHLKEEKTTKEQKRQLKAASLPNWLAHPLLVKNTDYLTTENGLEDDGGKRNDINLLGLQSNLSEQCTRIGLATLFPVQRAVIPLLLRRQISTLNHHQDTSLQTPRHQGDLLVSAPTGSGKTLSYVLPIIHALSSRVVTRLRALIILPTRELVLQVRETLLEMARGTSITIGHVIGGGVRSLKDEQAMLIESPVYSSTTSIQSRIDILVATPGRLMDHLEQTPGFTLEHLEYLVIDEADRLLIHSYNDWLTKVLLLAGKSREGTNTVTHSTNNLLVYTPDYLFPMMRDTKLQKLLFSATLTRNSEKIANLQLSNPLYVAVSGVDDMTRYPVPEQLEECVMICQSPGDKILQLVYLLYNYTVCMENSRKGVTKTLIEPLTETGIHQALCFTKSVESSRRLCQLLRLFIKQYSSTLNITDDTIEDYSSELSQHDRRQILQRFKRGEIRILVSSDLIARGIDLPNVTTVINYDIPSYIKQYIHRVGRTARAGHSGVAISLAARNEAKFFKEMMTKRGQTWTTYISKLKCGNTVEYRECIKPALSELRKMYSRGNVGNLTEVKDLAELVKSARPESEGINHKSTDHSSTSGSSSESDSSSDSSSSSFSNSSSSSNSSSDSSSDDESGFR